MALRVLGAGLPRTGTTSLRSALEKLLGERCYHMLELMSEREAGMLWMKALGGDESALAQVLSNYGAAVDWPASLFWRELVVDHPDALVILSHRGDAETWWNSVDKTVWAMMRRPDEEQQFPEFNHAMRAKAGLGDDYDDPAVAMAHYDSLYDEVVATVPAERLLTWQPSQGWEPICEALGVPVPDDEFFHLNTSTEFRSHASLE